MGELYSKACRNGLAIGCQNVGVMYYNGTGVKRNPRLASDNFRRALEINPGLTEARQNLARVARELGDK